MLKIQIFFKLNLKHFAYSVLGQFVVLSVLFGKKRSLHLTSNRSKDAFYAFAFWPERRQLKKYSLELWEYQGLGRTPGGIWRVTHQSVRMKNGQSAIRQIESKKNMAEMLLFQTANGLSRVPESRWRWRWSW